MIHMTQRCANMYENHANVHKKYANMHKDAMHADMKGRYTKLTVSFVRYCGIL